METKRQLDVLDRHLANNSFMCGEEYSIADIAIWPWYGILVQGKIYGESATFLDAQSYENVVRWASQIEQREAVQRGRKVNRSWGEDEEQVRERHSASDIDSAGNINSS